MIIKESQLLSQFKDIDIKYQPVLLYGPNEGLIRQNKDRIKKTVTKNNILEISFTGKSINEKPDIFYDEVKKYSYMWREGGQFSTEKYKLKDKIDN